jgi:tetratricopeptide (TPR) repeat protein
MFIGTIQGYGQIMRGNFSEGLETYKTSLVGTALDHDARVTLINLINSNPQILSSLNSSKADEALDYVILLAKENVTLSPNDSLMQMQLAQTLDAAARFYYYTDEVKSKDYSNQALKAIDLSIAASPERTPVYLFKSQVLLLFNRNEEAIDTAKYAISLNPKYYKGYCDLAKFYIILEDGEAMGSNLVSCFDLGGANTLRSNSLLANGLSYFSAKSDYKRALIAAKRLAALNQKDADILLNLAKLYLINGDKINAQEAARQAIGIDKTLDSSWTDFEKIFISIDSSSSSSVPSSSSSSSSESK